MVSLGVTGRIRALAFSPGGHDLAVGSGAGLVLIPNAGGGDAAAATLFEPDDGPLRPAGAAFTADGSSVLVADQSGSIVSVNLKTGAATTTSCHCQPDGMFGMSSGVFRLTNLSGGSIRLFESRTGQVLVAPDALAEGARP
jgi:hypothetical protein